MNDEVYPLLKPYMDEVERLNIKIEKLNKTIDILSHDIDDLRYKNRHLIRNHEDSGLNRDIPKAPKWQDIKYNENDYCRYWYCSVCDLRVSNWDSYCSHCGQRIKWGEHIPENEIKEGENK